MAVGARRRGRFAGQGLRPQPRAGGRQGHKVVPGRAPEHRAVGQDERGRREVAATAVPGVVGPPVRPGSRLDRVQHPVVRSGVDRAVGADDGSGRDAAPQVPAPAERADRRAVLGRRTAVAGVVLGRGPRRPRRRPRRLCGHRERGTAQVPVCDGRVARRWRCGGAARSEERAGQDDRGSRPRPATRCDHPDDGRAPTAPRRAAGDDEMRTVRRPRSRVSGRATAGAGRQ